MSAADRPAAAAGALRAPRPEEPRLSLVAAPPVRASSGAFVVLLGGILGVGLLGLLAVNMLLTQGSFTTSTLSAKQASLADQEQQLQQDVALLQSPRALAVAATALGMVATHNPVFIDTRTGRVLGVPQAAPRPVVAGPTASPSPAPTGTATATAAPTAKPTAGATTKPTTKPTTRPTTGATTAPTTKPSPHTSPTPHTSPSPHATGAP